MKLWNKLELTKKKESCHFLIQIMEISFFTLMHWKSLIQRIKRNGKVHFVK